jgi:hypothetical protein
MRIKGLLSKLALLLNKSCEAERDRKTSISSLAPYVRRGNHSASMHRRKKTRILSLMRTPQVKSRPCRPENLATVSSDHKRTFSTPQHCRDAYATETANLNEPRATSPGSLFVCRANGRAQPLSVLAEFLHSDHDMKRDGVFRLDARFC